MITRGLRTPLQARHRGIRKMEYVQWEWLHVSIQDRRPGDAKAATPRPDATEAKYPKESGPFGNGENRRFVRSTKV